MQEKHLFEYAIIRVVPRVEREEFMNVGAILYCKTQKFLKAVFSVNEERVKGFCSKTDLEELEAYLHSLEKICDGAKDGGPIALLDLPSRFRWLTATRSTMVQTSKVHPGFCTDAARTLDKIYTTMVL